MARYIEDIVDPTGDKVVPVLVAANGIPGEVIPLIRTEVGLQISRVIAKACSGHTRPRITDGKHAFNVVALHNLTSH